MKDVSKMDIEEAINTQYILHNKKKWLHGIRVELGRGRGGRKHKKNKKKNTFNYSKRYYKLIIN